MKAWFRDYGRATFGSTDFVLGLVAGVATFGFALANPSAARSHHTEILLGVGALGVALLAVVLTAMAILGAISPEYRRVLARAKRGVAGAFMPYRTVAVISGTLILVALAGLLLTEVGNDLTAALGAGLVALLAVWATWGTVQLTELTSWHTQRQARLEADPTPDEIQAYRDRLRSSGS